MKTYFNPYDDNCVWENGEFLQDKLDFSFSSANCNYFDETQLDHSYALLCPSNLTREFSQDFTLWQPSVQWHFMLKPLFHP